MCAGLILEFRVKTCTLVFPFLIIILHSSTPLMAVEGIEFSTFLGGSDWEHARDIFVDDSGNVFIVGGTKSDDFPTTVGAFQRTHDKSGKRVGSGGYCDAFVCKFDVSGQLVWSTLLGGPNYDRAYAVEVDTDGFVYVSGRGGPGFPVTEGSFQSTFQGSDGGIYGMQNGFIAKLSPDGASLVWSSYVGVGLLCRDIALDQDNDVYLPMSYPGKGPLPPSSWFSGALQATPAGDVDVGALKVSSDGKQVLWATWLGGSAKETPNAGIRLDDSGNVFLNLATLSSDLPTTAGAHDRSYNGQQDAFIAKLSPDGSKLLYGTYFGGSENEYGNSTHNLAIDRDGNAYLVTSTDGHDMPVTKNALQSQPKGQTDIVAAKFSPTGGLLHCTYLGGSGNEGPDGVYASSDGELFFSGTTSSSDFPITANAIQQQNAGQNDAITVMLSADFSSLKYSSLFGGSSYDDGRSCFLSSSNLYLTGSTNGPGWPTRKAYQEKFAGGGGGKELCYQGGCFAGDVVLTKIVLGDSE
jgi:hypothetical protein